ncbi:hypothetical protein [Limosilactobacillus reuteri]|uniref:hypothetical protein n=1 Tax=Limosilactobacillus reuteri TaxID=1598 RepID=UPI001E589B0A|nr:hypothetical protein [Limosilactobacillus reuteri]MCC4369323.1 hypothetical protein [Limosilactobacillus reuteri]MCC4502089.1 hypothetical protein [Limosilactobacillus reuteri]
MANCITPKLLDAINALNIKQFESRETRSLEELLDPHDWRLVEVLKFRQRIKDAERNNEQHTINSIKRSFEKYKLTDKVQQAIVLRYLGLNFGEIQAVTDLGRNKIYHHVIHKFPDLGPKDVDLKIVENRLRTQGLEKILREFQANVS